MNVRMIKYSELTEVKTIACGGFGVVHRAKHPDWETVAYKELKAEIIPDRSRFVCYSYRPAVVILTAYRPIHQFSRSQYSSAIRA